jgi:uncharacterized caspase-like protein
MIRWLIPVLLGTALLAPAADEGKTFVLAVGISQFKNLPKDLWLQYPDIDAATVAKFMASPRAGSVPASQMLLLTNEKATVDAVRTAFHSFLEGGKAGPKDTVIISIASHGTVDNHGAYIMTYDSDPNNFEKTALPMAEVHSLVESAVKKVGHVVLLADVCRAATIAGTKTDTLGAVIEEIGEAQGELLGLMAARPKELSLEGPTFGGGHGAFTYSVLKAMSGAADADKDGFVTAGELIDYVTTNVPSITTGRQHPRDFGNMDNALRLTDLSKAGIDLP